MKLKIKTLAVALLALLASACGNEDMAPAGSDHLTDAPVSITVGGVETRAGYDKGDVIDEGSLGFWLDQSGTQYDAENLEVKYESEVWVPQGRLLWRNSSDDVEYAASYPYDADGVYEVKLPADQFNSEMLPFDILYAEGRVKGEDGAVNIVFSHALAQLKVKLTFGETLGTHPKIMSMTLSNAALSGTFTVRDADGRCAWSNQGNIGEVTLRKNYSAEFECLLIPQTIEDYYITVEAEVDGIEKLYQFESSDLVLEQGATYTLPLQVGKSQHPYVDLELSSGTLWATYNVGATAPEEFGDYFAWGETEPMESPYGWAVYKWGNADNKLTKYCNDKTYGKDGFTDNLLALELDDDAARVQWGKEWLMPTEAQINELRDECAWEHYTLKGVNGYRGTGKNGNTIFFPMADYYEEDGEKGTTDRTYYWSSTLDDFYTPCAHALFFSSDAVKILNSSISRSYACPIRPVRSE